jgi:N-acetylmuramoyl-L-alanine amidase
MQNQIIVTATIILLIVAVSFFSINAKSNDLIIKTKYELLTPEAQKQVQCLAKNIYFEARSEPEQGKIAVAFVTLNRVMSLDFPNTICDVVEQKTRVANIGDKRVVCQFSWYCESMPYYLYVNQVLTNRNDMKYNSIRDLALHVYANYERMEDPTNGSLFYHADYVNPNWRNLERVTKIGAHIFYVKKENI